MRIATFNDLQKLKLNRSGRGIVSNAEVAYKKFEYPILMHLAMRRQGIPNQTISERLGIKKHTVKRMAHDLGVTDPTTKICASGSDHSSWKGGKVQTSITDDWIWNQEVKQYRRAKTLSCWSQHIEAQRWEWNHKYHNSSPELKIKRMLRKAIRQAINQQSVKKKTQLALGCDIKFLRAYLETRFEEGMTWGNYGSEWHIDHVKPLSSFDLSRKPEQLKANHYTNLQPLWASDNLSKGDRYYRQPALI